VIREALPGTEVLVLEGELTPQYMGRELTLTVFVDGTEVGNQSVPKANGFRVGFRLRPKFEPGIHTIEVRSKPWFIPHQLMKNGDYRPLTWRMSSVDSVGFRSSL
jgi:hypothetical protein